ncbi:DNA-3-methyladenine glycosylase I [Mameliella alba]|uniref:DNA-3-methyladenine glycosylase I n=1 Tax=Mameliella alba TaxID=561184 RepID=UPI00088994C6|nr:DNA-3-methyladenine glycosylase I [Mameliella alba]OWV47553.1 3-methyladenine DNA glycosylase [Mameliella alba]PTR38424.1 DNA-3-methyladenine glycosylase I [Mameliella alba]GGF59256.1 DNA-3-methyladenine glycosylase [Mameliella alba]SDC84334.1 DNA-3-methyladenine glycosylase I [Mameliella alba]
MRTYEEILDFAADRKGGRAAVLADIPPVLDADALAAIPDDRWLAQMARGIFQAGISWQVVENKWPGIEEAFHGFDVGRAAMMSEDWFDELLADPRIVRSPPKVQAIQQNAVFIQEVSAEAGSFGRKVGDWPAEDFAGLLDWMKTNGARLGGATGAYTLRFLGKESFILSPSVVARLVAEGVVDKAPTSKKAMQAVQAAFNTWKDQSGENLTVISRVLAQSVDA